MIPKKIHFIWLGGKKKNKLTEVCINTWERYLPDYEIIEWNEDKLDLDSLCDQNAFLKKCYDLRLWAFVSDYLRLWILEQEGGIYLDTDVEVIKSFNDLLNDSVFMGYEANDYLGTAVIGAEANNKLIKRLRSFYDKEIWDVDLINNPMIFKHIKQIEPEIFNECKLYPQDFFSPYNPYKEHKGVVEKPETYAIHWYTNDWNLSLKGYVFIHTKHIKHPVIRAIEKIRKYYGYRKHV